ncbi:MAG: ribonuclease H-like domain-containing protein [Halobacteriaceae archaeon]
MRLENSFVPVEGVGTTTERQLWQSGVTHWDHFAPNHLGGVRGERVAAFIDDARDKLAAGEAGFFATALPSGELWRAYENFRSGTCFFDIETTGLDADTSVVTTVSCHRDGETRTYVRGEDLTADALRREFADADLLATFNGKRFDVPFLEQRLGLSVDTPHLDLMYPCRRLDLTGGLKAIEREIGLERDRPDISGRDAVRLWHEHERGADGALETLVSYNREDAVNLRTLADVVTDRLHDEVFVAPETGAD